MQLPNSHSYGGASRGELSRRSLRGVICTFRVNCATESGVIMTQQNIVREEIIDTIAGDLNLLEPANFQRQVPLTEWHGLMYRYLAVHVEVDPVNIEVEGKAEAGARAWRIFGYSTSIVIVHLAGPRRKLLHPFH